MPTRSSEAISTGADILGWSDKALGVGLPGLTGGPVSGNPERSMTDPFVMVASSACSNPSPGRPVVQSTTGGVGSAGAAPVGCGSISVDLSGPPEDNSRCARRSTRIRSLRC